MNRNSRNHNSMNRNSMNRNSMNHTYQEVSEYGDDTEEYKEQKEEGVLEPGSPIVRQARVDLWAERLVSEHQITHFCCCTNALAYFTITRSS